MWAFIITVILIASAFASDERVAEDVTDCDVFIAGGSLSAIAAALSAASNSPSVRVCMTEIADELGGQLTASAVSAIDYGDGNKWPHRRNNNPTTFNDLVDSIAVRNPTLGHCWVSTVCFLPSMVAPAFAAAVAARPNLRIWMNTTIVASTVSPDGTVVSVTAVQRTPRSGRGGFDALLSTQLEDWYSPNDSDFFTKQSFRFTNFSVVLDATEFGDVLLTSGLPVVQGFEYPNQNSTATYDRCGQAVTLSLYMTLQASAVPNPWPPGSDEGVPFSTSNSTFDRIWTYRRSIAVGNQTGSAVTGETSLQNWGGGNDLVNYYLFADLATVRQRIAAGKYDGGLNFTALAAAEQRAYGWYHFYKNLSGPSLSPRLSLNNTVAGTAHGLAKLPYLRDTRRSAEGLGGFRLTYQDLAGIFPNGSTAPNSHGVPFDDTIAIGDYFYADIHRMTDESCPYPPYILRDSPVKPYYIPFRALTVASSLHTLVAGKLMAQTFWANAGTRLHPEEWSTGTAAGIAAALMHRNNWDSATLYQHHIHELQGALLDYGVPLEWNHTMDQRKTEHR